MCECKDNDIGEDGPLALILGLVDIFRWKCVYSGQFTRIVTSRTFLRGGEFAGDVYSGVVR